MMRWILANLAIAWTTTFSAFLVPISSVCTVILWTPCFAYFALLSHSKTPIVSLDLITTFRVQL